VRLQKKANLPALTLLPSLLGTVTELNDRRAPAAALGRGVGEGFDGWMAQKHLSDDGPLCSGSPTVDEPNLAEPSL